MYTNTGFVHEFLPGFDEGWSDMAPHVSLIQVSFLERSTVASASPSIPRPLSSETPCVPASRNSWQNSRARTCAAQRRDNAFAVATGTLNMRCTFFSKYIPANWTRTMFFGGKETLIVHKDFREVPEEEIPDFVQLAKQATSAADEDGALW